MVIRFMIFFAGRLDYIHTVVAAALTSASAAGTRRFGSEG
jgi:hypothetical protein